VETVVSGKVSAKEFMAFFESAKDVDKGTCADVMKHVSVERPALFAPYIDMLIEYINFELPRVKWGVSETLGNMAKDYPDKVAKTIPNLLKNTTDDRINTTVIKWCAAFALAEIAKHNSKIRKQLVPIFEKIIKKEQNNGVKNVYVKALKVIEKINKLKEYKNMENTQTLCQSCGMPMQKPEDFGTIADGSKNKDYCCYCFQNGKFTFNGTFEEYKEMQVKIAVKKMNMPEDKAREMVNTVLPKLMRWRAEDN